MTRERKRFSWGRVPALVFIVLVWWVLIGAFIASQRPYPYGAPLRVSCLNNLRQLGGLIFQRANEERLELLPGSAILKQLSTDIRDEDLDVFACPGDPRFPRAADSEASGLLRDIEDLVKRYRADWRTAPRSYRGPDADLLAEAFAPDAPHLIIACDQNGPDGSDPFHADGIVVLYNSTKVDFIKWEQMEGYAGGPVKVGPGSPDPRFQRLIP